MGSSRDPEKVGSHVDPWVNAKDNFKKSLPPGSQLNNFTSSRSDVNKEIKKLQDDNNSKTQACLEKCKPFFDGVRSLDEVISPIAELEPHGIAAVVWGSVKICLNVSSDNNLRIHRC